MNYVQTLIEQIMMMFLIIGIGVFLEKKEKQYLYNWWIGYHRYSSYILVNIIK